MGILDALLGNNQNTEQDPKTALIAAAISMLAGGQQQQGGSNLLGSLGGLVSGLIGGNNSSPVGNALSGLLGQASGGQSGLSGLLQIFQNSGMAEQAQSWVSNNPNMPVNGEQIQNALSQSGLLSQFAQQANVPEGDAANHLAQILPDLINNATPEGKIPESGLDFASLAAKFLGK